MQQKTANFYVLWASRFLFHLYASKNYLRSPYTIIHLYVWELWRNHILQEIRSTFMTMKHINGKLQYIFFFGSYHMLQTLRIQAVFFLSNIFGSNCWSIWRLPTSARLHGGHASTTSKNVATNSSPHLMYFFQTLMRFLRNLLIHLIFSLSKTSDT